MDFFLEILPEMNWFSHRVRRPIYSQILPLEPASRITTILVLSFPVVQVFPASRKTTILVQIIPVVQVFPASRKTTILVLIFPVVKVFPAGSSGGIRL